MKRTKDLTLTFPEDILPTRRGVYQTRVMVGSKPSPWQYSFFDETDRIWGCAHDTPEMAEEFPEFEFAVQQKQWRGLAEDPVAISK